MVWCLNRSRLDPGTSHDALAKRFLEYANSGHVFRIFRFPKAWQPSKRFILPSMFSKSSASAMGNAKTLDTGSKMWPQRGLGQLQRTQT